MWKKITIIALFICFWSCKTENSNKEYVPNSNYEFAKNITFFEDEQKIIIDNNGNQVEISKNELPFTNIMVETTAAIAYLDELEAINLISGVTDPSFIYNPKILKKIAAKQVLEIGNSNELYLETILTNKPQLIIANSNPTMAKYHEQLIKNGIKILYLDEFRETTPLAQAEYLKIIGKLIGKEEKANQVFNQIKTNYSSTKQMIATKTDNNVTTLVNTMFGDTWYIPAKNSLQATLIDDAKGNYIYKDFGKEMVTNFTFEEVYTKAKNATHWINVINYTSLDEMKAANQNYAWFEAYKTGNVYNYSKRKSEKGANDIFEQGIVRPDIVLKDLGSIFHPQLFPNYELYFYEKLK